VAVAKAQQRSTGCQMPKGEEFYKQLSNRHCYSTVILSLPTFSGPIYFHESIKKISRSFDFICSLITLRNCNISIAISNQFQNERNQMI